MTRASPVRELPSVDSALAWFAERGVRALTTDSRRVQRGDAFIAWPGYANDGRRFVDGALASGAAACLVEADGADAFEFTGDGAHVASLRGLKANTGVLASLWYSEPSERLEVIAVTGTNGKTSTSWWVAQALAALGRRCGVIGTLGVGEPPLGRALTAADAANRRTASDTATDASTGIAFTGFTTPDPITVQQGFKRFADAGVGACAIEATSIGIAEHRLDGTKIDIALFTNFTQDHLDYHGTMDAYWAAKAQLFAWRGLKAAVLNIDDARGAALAPQLQGRLDVWTYSAATAAATSGAPTNSVATSSARLRAADVVYRDGGLAFAVVEAPSSASTPASSHQRADVSTALIGEYNVANLLAVIGALRALGVSLADAARACYALTPVPGRMDRVPAPRAAGDALPEVVVDYSHTPDALEKALQSLQPLAAQRGGALWCVFGCGGNRDATKRPLMGAIAQRLAQRVVVTSDNPRLENPHAIIEQILAGLDPKRTAPATIENRAAAIRHAVTDAAANDVILLAGKGHEDYQDIAGVKHPFSDIEQAAAALALRKATR